MPELKFEKIKKILTAPVPPIDEKLIKIGVVPKYTEITPYLISVIIILLSLTNSDFQAESFELFIIRGGIVSGGFLILIGIILSIYNVFINRVITKTEKYFILIAVLFFNLLVAALAGLHILEEEKLSWLIIFPVLNFFNVVFLYILFHFGAFTEKSISDVQARKEEVILGTIFIILIYFISHYIFNNYWAITFSICLVYATALVDLSDKIIIKNLLKR